MSTPSQFPLETVTDNQIQLLEDALWHWPIEKGHGNINSNGYEDETYKTRRSRRARYVDYYKSLTASYEPDFAAGETPAINSHEDLCRLIHYLKSKPEVPRSSLVGAFIQDSTIKAIQGRPARLSNQDAAVNLAIRVMFMINCSAQHQSLGLLEHGMGNVQWRNDSTLSQFITEIFPKTDHPGINDEDANVSVDIKTSLKARKLKKIAGLKFRPTDDLRSHLKLHHKTGVVEIFHHTAFLKEHLRLTKDAPRDISVAHCLER